LISIVDVYLFEFCSLHIPIDNCPICKLRRRQATKHNYHVYQKKFQSVAMQFTCDQHLLWLPGSSWAPLSYTVYG